MKNKVILLSLSLLFLFLLGCGGQETEEDYKDFPPISQRFNDDAIEVVDALKNQFYHGNKDDSIVKLYDDFKEFEKKYMKGSLASETEHVLFDAIRGGYSSFKRYHYDLNNSDLTFQMKEARGEIIQSYLDIIDEILENARVL